MDQDQEDEGVMCDNHPDRRATWLMGEKTSISLDWPFLCDECKAIEIAHLSEWPEDFVITWDAI